MAQHVLKMKYHPAMKKVEFEALQDGVRFSDYTTSPLYTDYESKPFLLQQHGDAFFEAIRLYFSGSNSVEIDVTTTKTDYEDLEQMVEYYNRELMHQKRNFRITTTLEAMLPDMDDIYQKVRDYGEEAAAILDYHRADFHTIESSNEVVQKSIKLFSGTVQDEINNIREKLRRMDDNNVNLCFAGIYSAGKSSLINAILGRRILPERVKPTTARSFRIRSPKSGEGIHIDFLIGNERAILAWKDETNCLSIEKSPPQNSSIDIIGNLLEKYKETSQHDQIYYALDHLNADNSVAPVIDVVFPIPLDRENVHFTILDTPGTDSNTIQHREVLKAALSEQENSILIFVAPANHASDGQGNQDLLKLLSNDGKAIDIDRSLFVMNFADCVDSEELKTLKNTTYVANDPKAKKPFQIDLSTKKVFFTSAKAAYLAKTVQNNIATEKDKKDFKRFYLGAVDEDLGRYYQNNHCATSGCATSKMLKRCQQAVKAAEGDQCQELFVCSGLFALEDEIIRYGEKYASAVRAHAIIDSVDQALVKMSGKAASLASDTYDSIHEIEAKIDRIRNSLKKAIAAEEQRFSLPNEKRLSDDVLIRLGLKNEVFEEKVSNPAIEEVKDILGFFKKVKFKEEQGDRIAEKIATELENFESTYADKRKTELEGIRSKFIHNIRTAIINIGDIDSDASDYICMIEPPALKPLEIKKVSDLYEGLKQSQRFLIFRREFLDKNEFLAKLAAYLRETQEETINEYKKDFCNELNAILTETSKAYMTNLEEYSLILKATQADKRSMEALLEKINKTALDLQKSKSELDNLMAGGYEQ